MLSLHHNCKPLLGDDAKPLKNGADYPVRTDGPLITNRGASLKTNDIPVNRAPDASILSDTYRPGVNRAGSHCARLNAEVQG